MAATKKKPSLDSPFTRTTSPTPLAQGANEIEVPEEGRTVPTSVGLKQSEIDLLDEIANRHEIARNAVMRYAVRLFLKDYLNGRIALAEDVETPPVPKKKLNMP